MVGFGRNLTISNTIICIKAYGRVAVPIYVIYIHNKKRTGPRTELCLTPDVTSVISDRDPLTVTLCLQLDRKDLIQFLVFPVIP